MGDTQSITQWYFSPTRDCQCRSWPMRSDNPWCGSLESWHPSCLLHSRPILSPRKFGSAEHLPWFSIKSGTWTYSPHHTPHKLSFQPCTCCISSGEQLVRSSVYPAVHADEVRSGVYSGQAVGHNQILCFKTAQFHTLHITFQRVPNCFSFLEAPKSPKSL